MSDHLEDKFKVWLEVWDRESAVTCVLDPRLRQMCKESLVSLLFRAYNLGREHADV